MIRTLPVLVAALLAAPSGWTSGPAAQVAAPGQVTPPRAAGPAPATATGTAVIRGTVVAMDTGTPLRRVQITAFGSTQEAGGPRVTNTDEQGRYELRELTAGRYTVSARKAGFVALQYGQRRPSERGTPVELADGETIERVTIALPRGSVVTGRIADDAGEPLAGAQVQVMRYQFTPGGRRLMPAGMNDRTDDTGAFRLYGLPPGEYYISARPEDQSMMMPGARAAGDSDQGYAPTYYPGTPSIADAERITLGVGQEVAGISFALTPTRLSRVSGRVIGWPGRGMGFISVTPEDGTMLNGMLPSGRVQPEGDFEVRGIPPGRYVLQVQPRGPRDEDVLVGTTSLTVAGTDVSNVTIAMQRPGRIRGRVDFEGGVPSTIRPSQVQVYLQPLDPGPRAFFTGPPEMADDFTFTARVPLGPVLVRAGIAGWYLKAVEADGQDATDTALNAAPGAEIDGVRVLLTQTVTTLTGSVRNDRGDAILDAVVVVFPDDEARWTFGSRFIRSTRPDTEGRYEFTALPPSNGYRIAAVPALEDGQVFDPDFLGSIRDRAERLALAEGETKAIELRLRP
jgi:hypothetical protein